METDFNNKVAIEFQKSFYRIINNAQRIDELMTYFQENSVLLWNGIPQQGQKNIVSFLKTIPPAQYEISSLDCHQISGTNNINLLINIVGKVKYSPSNFHTFSETFILSNLPNTSTFYITSDVFRLTS